MEPADRGLHRQRADPEPVQVVGDVADADTDGGQLAGDRAAVRRFPNGGAETGPRAKFVELYLSEK